MYTNSINTSVDHTIRLDQALDPDHIVGVDSCVADIKHKEFYTHRIVIGKAVFYVMERKVHTILREWGITFKYDGCLNVTETRSRTEHGFGAIRYKAEMVSRTTEPMYACDSKQVFKPVNKLIKQIRAERIVAPKLKYKHGRYSPGLSITLALHAVLMNDTFKGARLLDDYPINHIESVFADKTFRHVYKIIHPDTEIIQKLIT